MADVQDLEAMPTVTVKAVFFIVCGAAIFSMWLGHALFPASETQVMQIPVDVIANTAKCEKLGGRIVGTKIVTANEVHLGFDAYHFFCEAPEKILYEI